MPRRREEELAAVDQEREREVEQGVGRSGLRGVDGIPQQRPSVGSAEARWGTGAAAAAVDQGTPRARAGAG